MNRSIIAAIIFSTCFISTAARAYENAALRVSFDTPSGWVVDQSDDRSVMLKFSADAEDKDIARIKLDEGDDSWMTEDEPITSLSQLGAYERGESRMNTAGKDWHILDESDVTIGGMSGKQFTFSTKIPLSSGTREIKGREVYYFSGDKLMVLSFHCAEEKFDAYWPSVKAVFETFKLTQ